MKSCVTCTNAPSAIGPYSQAIQETTGQMIFISGQLPIDPRTAVMPPDIAAQALQSITNIESILKEAGADLSHVVKTTVFLKDMNDFAAVNEVYARCFPSPFPARSAIEVVRLPRDARIEIEAIAMI